MSFFFWARRKKKAGEQHMGVKGNNLGPIGLRLTWGWLLMEDQRKGNGPFGNKHAKKKTLIDLPEV